MQRIPIPSLGEMQGVPIPSLGPIGTQQAIQRTSWDDHKKKSLCELLRQQSNPHNRNKGGWSMETWFRVTEAMQRKYPGASIDVTKLKNLERDLKKLVYHPVRAILLRYTGLIQWDSKNCMLDASNDNWTSISKIDQDAIKWRSKIIPYYEDLAALYEGHDDVAKGPQAQGENGFNALIDFSAQQNETSTTLGITAEMNYDNNRTQDFFPTDMNDFVMPDSTPSNVAVNLPTDPNVPQPSNFAQGEPIEFMNTTYTNPLAMTPPLNFVAMPGNCQQPNSQIPAPNNVELGIPDHTMSEFKNVNPVNTNSDMGNDLSLSSGPDSHVRPTSRQTWENNDLSDRSDKPLKTKINRKINPKKKIGVRNGERSNFSMQRCIDIFYELRELQDCDVHHVVSIFDNEQKRAAFVALKKRDKIYWLKKEIEEKYFIQP